MTPSTRKVIGTDQAPRPVGPYSQAIQVGNTLFVAGQLGLDPATSKLVEGGVQAQARQALQNLAAILEAAGGSLAHVVKTTIFMDNLDDFGQVNEIYGTFFSESPPARSTLEVARLPLGGLVEIEAIAVIE